MQNIGAIQVGSTACVVHDLDSIDIVPNEVAGVVITVTSGTLKAKRVRLWVSREQTPELLRTLFGEMTQRKCAVHGGIVRLAKIIAEFDKANQEDK